MDLYEAQDAVHFDEEMESLKYLAVCVRSERQCFVCDLARGYI